VTLACNRRCNTQLFLVLKESHTLVFSLEVWQNTSKTFPFEPFRNMSRAHNEAKLLFLPYTSYGQRKSCVSHLLGNRSSFRQEKALLNHPSLLHPCKNEGRSTSM